MAGSVKPVAPPELLKNLRHQLASAISDFKAYDVPALCRRIGLSEGTDDEAYASKYRYAMARLNELSGEKLVSAGRMLLTEEPSFDLEEAIHHISEYGGHLISEITRRRVVTALDEAQLCTEIELIDFLGRIWPIDKMPSCYYPQSSRSMSDEIFQHCVNNFDWSNKELLDRLGVFSCSQNQFFKFVSYVTDPLVQSAERQTEIVQEIDAILSHDDFKLVKIKVVSGCPFYTVKAVVKGAPSDLAISDALKAFNPDDVHTRWTAAMESREIDPPRAITLARTLLEDVCKWIIAEDGGAWNEKDDLPALYKKLAAILKLAPDDHTEVIFKQILGSCQNIVESLGALRNKLSDAHSIGPLRARPSPRHAELAVNLAGTMATFLVSTWSFRKKTRGPGEVS